MLVIRPFEAKEFTTVNYFCAQVTCLECGFFILATLLECGVFNFLTIRVWYQPARSKRARHS